MRLCVVQRSILLFHCHRNITKFQVEKKFKSFPLFGNVSNMLRFYWKKIKLYQRPSKDTKYPINVTNEIIIWLENDNIRDKWICVRVFVGIYIPICISSKLQAHQ